MDPDCQVEQYIEDLDTGVSGRFDIPVTQDRVYTEAFFVYVISSCFLYIFSRMLVLQLIVYICSVEHQPRTCSQLPASGSITWTNITVVRKGSNSAPSWNPVRFQDVWRLCLDVESLIHRARSSGLQLPSNSAELDGYRVHVGRRRCGGAPSVLDTQQQSRVERCVQDSPAQLIIVYLFSLSTISHYCRERLQTERLKLHHHITLET